MSDTDRSAIENKSDIELFEMYRNSEDYHADYIEEIKHELVRRDINKFEDFDRSIVKTFTVKPAPFKGGKGTYIRLSSPSEVVFEYGKSPKLRTRYEGMGTGWLALIATILTGLTVHAMTAVYGFSVGPGIIIWYAIIRYFRRKNIEINFSDAQEIIIDEEKLGLAILCSIEGKVAWIGLKLRENYDSITRHLEKCEDVSLRRARVFYAHKVAWIIFVILFWVIGMIVLPKIFR